MIESLIRTGNEIRCYRTKEIITLDMVKFIEREHVIPLALGGTDDPLNAAYSLAAAHKKQTNGTKATSYGSDKHAIAKIKRLKAGGRKSKGPKLKSKGFNKQLTRKFSGEVVKRDG